MKALKIILVVLLIILGGLSIWNLTLDPAFETKRTIKIEAPQEVVFNIVGDFKTWPEWSHWFKDTTMVATFDGPTSGMDAGYSWTSKQSGSGFQNFTGVYPSDSLTTYINFGMMGDSDGKWTFSEENGATSVSWQFNGEMPFLLRFMAAGIEPAVGPQFEEGLSNLKAMAEKMAEDMTPTIQIEESSVEALSYYSISDMNMSWDAMSSEFFGERFGALTGYLGKDMQNVTAPPFTIFHKWDEENKTTDVEVGMAANSNLEGSEKISKGMTYEGMVLKASYYGPYEGTGAAHEAIYAYSQENGYEMVGSPWESYVTDPSTEPDVNKWLTEIYYPVSK